MRRVSLVLCVSLSLVLFGCSRSNETSTTIVTSAELTPSFVEPDPVLTQRAESALASNDGILSYAARNVEVTVDEDGVATLSGTVADREYKAEAERMVFHVAGITRVENNIDVSLVRNLYDEESDDRIAFSLQRSMAVIINSDRVSIDVDHGKVTLRGKTPDDFTRDLIAAHAQQTHGVTAVVNEIETGS